MPFKNRLLCILREERAFGIIEALMAMAIMTLVLVALLGLLTVSVKAVAATKLSTIATQVANEYIEDIRALPYESVVAGTTEETRTVLGIEFGITTEIIWVDDAADGIGEADPDGPQDYKQVTITVAWLERGATKKVSATTFVKSKPVKTEPPTVNFIFGDSDFNKTPPNGTIFGLGDYPESPFYNETYETWFEDGTIPLKGKGEDNNGDLVSMRFIVGGITPDGGIYGFDQTGYYENTPICRWNPQAVGEDGKPLWTEGVHEVVVEAWDSQGNRDAKSIFWIIDRFPPLWRDEEPSNLSALAIGKDTIRLAWNKAWDGNEQVNRYRVYRKGPSQIVFTVLEEDLNAPAATFDNSGLGEWETHQYYLTALSQGGRESTQTSEIAIATTWFGITGTSKKEQGKRKVEIKWNSPPVTVEYFKISRNGTFLSVVVPGNAVSFTDDNNGAGLPGKTPYEYKVFAYDSDGQINQSIPISVVTEN